MPLKNLEYFSLIAKFTCSKLDTNQKCFYISKAFKLWKWTILFFLNVLFFYQMCTILFENWKGFYHWWLEEQKDINSWKLFCNRFEHIWFKGVFDLENYGFWKCGLKNLCNRRHEFIIYDIKSICSQNIFIFYI